MPGFKRINIFLIGGGIVLILFLWLIIVGTKATRLASFDIQAYHSVFLLQKMQMLAKSLKNESVNTELAIGHWQKLVNEVNHSIDQLQERELSVGLPADLQRELNNCIKHWRDVQQDVQDVEVLFKEVKGTELENKIQKYGLKEVYLILLDDVSAGNEIRAVKKMIRTLDLIDGAVNISVRDLGHVVRGMRQKARAFMILINSSLVILLLTVAAFSIVGLYDVYQLNACLIEEVTERKSTEKALMDKEERLRITLNSIGDAVIAVDNQYQVTNMNPLAEKMTGWKREDALGRNIADIYAAFSEGVKEALELPLKEAMKERRVVISEGYKMLRTREEAIYISESAAPVTDNTGDIIGAVLVFRNVTGLVKMETELMQNRKMESIGQLAGGIAHDFNNMLTGIIGAADMLKKQMGNSKDSGRYIALISKTAKRAAEITQQLLDFSRRGKALTTPIDVHQTLNHVLAVHQANSDHKVIVKKRLEAKAVVINGDRDQLENAFANIINNAWEVMEQGGILSVRTENVDLDEHECRKRHLELREGTYLLIHFTDTGPGLPASLKGRIFEPFFTTSKEDCKKGLGLAAVYGTSVCHHGMVVVDSVVGEGATFSIYLPLPEQAA